MKSESEGLHCTGSVGINTTAVFKIKFCNTECCTWDVKCPNSYFIPLAKLKMESSFPVLLGLNYVNAFLTYTAEAITKLERCLC